MQNMRNLQDYWMFGALFHAVLFLVLGLIKEIDFINVIIMWV